MDHAIQHLVLEAASIVRRTADVLMKQQARIGCLAGLEEGGREVKLRADEVADELLLAPLLDLGPGVLSEETGWREGREGGLRWIVDPLDGSLNYLRGMGYCGISVGLFEGETPLAGILFDLHEGALVTGIPGEGAFCENTALHVSDVSELQRAVLTTGFPARMSYDDATLTAYIRQVKTFQKIRMFGSAVQSCLNVARGRCDAYYEQDVMIWDVAGGAAVIRAAGGHCEITPGSREHAVAIWACTPGLASHNPRNG